MWVSCVSTRTIQWPIYKPKKDAWCHWAGLAVIAYYLCVKVVCLTQ